jgi:hypothetical protein
MPPDEGRGRRSPFEVRGHLLLLGGVPCVGALDDHRTAPPEERQGIHEGDEILDLNLIRPHHVEIQVALFRSDELVQQSGQRLVDQEVLIPEQQIDVRLPRHA